MLNQLVNQVIDWAEARNIIKGSTPIKQHDKLLEEVMELRDAIISNSMNPHVDWECEIEDAIGDCTVCLINMAKMFGMDFEGCLGAAYDEIKNRKGQMIDGVFVKESSIKNFK